MTTLQVQARALGDPTRYDIFRYLVEAEAPVDVAELTAHFGLNHNAVRQHLAKLLEAGLVAEGKAVSSGRGRPRLTYRVHHAVDSRWGVVGPYERLSLLLAEVLRTGDDAVDVGRRAAARLHLDPEADGVASMAEAMARQGFDPLVRERGQRLELVLQTCPFESAALAAPETVCRMHLGMAEGMAERTGGRVAVEELVVHDPRRARCRLLLRRDDPAGRGAA